MMEEQLINTNKMTWKLFFVVGIIMIAAALLMAIFLRDYFAMTFWQVFAAGIIGGVSGGAAVWRLGRKR